MLSWIQSSINSIMDSQPYGLYDKWAEFLVVSSCTGTQRNETLANCVTTPCVDMKTIGIPPCTGTPGQPRIFQVKIYIFNCNWLKTKLGFNTKLDLGLCLPNRNVHQVHSFFKSTEGKIWFGPLFTYVRSTLYRFPFSVNSFYHHRLSILG